MTKTNKVNKKEDVSGVYIFFLTGSPIRGFSETGGGRTNEEEGKGEW